MKNNFPLTFEQWCEAKGIPQPIPYSGETNYMAKRSMRKWSKKLIPKLRRLKMKVKIKENPSWPKLKPYAGKWIKIETEHLFTNQYNTVPLSEDCCGLRIEDKDIEAIVGDARKGKGKCIWCGNIVNSGEICSVKPQCSKNEIVWFTKENTYFLKYPSQNSIDIILV